MTNEELAQRLRSHARWLTQRGENLYRIRAFRQATMAVLELREPFLEVYGQKGFVPGIGESITVTLLEYARTGIWKADDSQTAPVAPKTTSGETGVSVSPDRFKLSLIAEMPITDRCLS